jgi:hypothetical protein
VWHALPSCSPIGVCSYTCTAEVLSSVVFSLDNRAPAPEGLWQYYSEFLHQKTSFLDNRNRSPDHGSQPDRVHVLSSAPGVYGVVVASAVSP